MTNAFELSLLQQWGCCSPTGHRGGWFGGSPVNSGKTTPQPPYRPPALLLSNKGICFQSAECTEYKQVKGSHIPLYLNTSSGKPTSAKVSVGISPCSTSAPRVGMQWLVHFLP